MRSLPRVEKPRIYAVCSKRASSCRDLLHQISSKPINENPVCLEDLNIKGILRNRCLSKTVANSGLFKFRRQLEYEAKWASRDIFIADRFPPTSKICSERGSYQAQILLKIHKWIGPNCNTNHDRNIDAAQNILLFGTMRSLGTHNAL